LAWPIINSVTSDHELLGDIVRQALDFDGAGDDFEQSALHLHALGLAGGSHRHADADTLGEIDAFEIGVQQRAADGIQLLVDHHHRGGLAAGDFQVEDGVIAGSTASDLGDLARIHGNRDGIFVGSINNCRNLPRTARAMRFVLAARGTHLGGDYDIFYHFILLRVRSPFAEDIISRRLTPMNARY
jgi:hypothetical protein